MGLLRKITTLTTAAAGFVGGAYVSQNTSIQREEKEKATLIRLIWQDRKGQFFMPPETLLNKKFRAIEDVFPFPKRAGLDSEDGGDNQFARIETETAKPGEHSRMSLQQGSSSDLRAKCGPVAKESMGKCGEPKKVESKCSSQPPEPVKKCGQTKKSESKCPTSKCDTPKEPETKYFPRQCAQKAAVQPVEPANKCGQPVEPANKCGQPVEPANKCGQPLEPANKCGQPVQPANKCGQPVEPANRCGQPVAPANKCGQLVEPTNKCGQPVEPTNKCGQPAKPMNQFGQIMEDSCPTKSTEPVNKCGTLTKPEVTCSKKSEEPLNTCNKCNKPKQPEPTCPMKAAAVPENKCGSLQDKSKAKCNPPKEPDSQCAVQKAPESQCPKLETTKCNVRTSEPDLKCGQPANKCGTSNTSCPTTDTCNAVAKAEDTCGKKVCQIRESPPVRKRCRARSSSVGKTGQKEGDMTQTDPQTCKPVPETPSEIGKKCAQSK